MTEYKYTPLAELKVSDKGNGEISGYRAVFGVIDEGGDIIIRGAFKDTLDQYLSSGFTAQAHNWDFKEAIGFPVEAYEDDYGWFVRSEFHSTRNAQDARTIAKERLRAKKTVGFSFGYGVINSHNIEPGRYEMELPRYLKSSYLNEGLRKAQRFARIRILKVLEAIEDSIVTAPMNKLAMATGVKCSHCSASSISTASLRAEHARLRLQNLTLRLRGMEVLHGIDLGIGPTTGELRLKSEEIRNRVRRTLALSRGRLPVG